MGDRRFAFKVLVRKHEKSAYVGDQGVDGRMILHFYFK
jgi:hypothetical protein